jgi:hypothetical protein
MSLMRLTRVRAALVLLLIYAGVSDARWLYRAVRGGLDARQVDPITRYERRFSVLKRVLPQRGVVGYTSGLPPGEFVSEDFKRFLLTEYALAPLVIVNDTGPQLVIGNFDPDRIRSTPALPGLEIVRDFGDGLRLLRKASR